MAGGEAAGEAPRCRLPGPGGGREALAVSLGPLCTRENPRDKCGKSVKRNRGAGLLRPSRPRQVRLRPGPGCGKDRWTDGELHARAEADPGSATEAEGP